jgi:hypothetical protein
VVTRYAYRDYAGHEHVATGEGSWSIISARTMEGTDFGYPAPGVRSLGRPVTLRF